jgi:ABC-type amino acid transport substrate-binding protein
MKQYLITTCTAALISVLVVIFWPHRSSSNVVLSAKTETAFERVLRTGVLRCGYFIYPGYTDKDLTTNALTGLMPDLMSALGEDLNLSVEWAKEVPLPEFSAALASGHIDAMCGPLGMIPARFKASTFTRAYGYLPIFPAVRIDDIRFDSRLESINAPEVTIAAIEGQATALLARRLFPQSKLHEVMDMAGITGALSDVATGKADVVFVDKPTLDSYLTKNPGVLKVAGRQPLGVYAMGLPVALGEHDLKHLLDGALSYAIDSGVVDSLVRKHGFDQTILPVTPSYSDKTP